MAKTVELKKRLDRLQGKIESAAKADTPEARLFLEIILQAVRDLANPNPKWPEHERIDAALFLQSTRCAQFASLINLDMEYVSGLIKRMLPEINVIAIGDACLIKQLAAEREAINDSIVKLKAQAAALSDKAIALKFDLNEDQVRQIVNPKPPREMREKR